MPATGLIKAKRSDWTKSNAPLSPKVSYDPIVPRCMSTTMILSAFERFESGLKVDPDGGKVVLGL